MFMQGHIEEISNQTWTPRARLVFGRHRIYAGRTFALSPTITTFAVSELLYLCHAADPFRNTRPKVWCTEAGIEIQVCPESPTVQALYEGLLVALWTTAQKIPQHRWSSSAQLATVLVFLATLTAVGRCYATESADAPLGQFNLSSQIFYNSKFPTSSLVLSRLFIPGRLVKSDIRVIRGFSKVNRTKRDFSSSQRNRTTDLKAKSTSEENSTTFKNSNPSIDLLSLRTAKIFDQVDFELTPLAGNASERESGTPNTTRVLSTNNTEVEAHQNDSSFHEGRELLESTRRPMPPAHAHDNESSGAVSAFGFVLVVVLLTGAFLGLVTCLLSHQRGTGGASGAGEPAATHPHHAADSPTTAPMLSVVSAGAAAGMGGMDRLRGGRAAARDLAATRDRQVRLHAVHTDIAINLPHSIAMPDGEEHPFTTSRLHIRDAEQESEIYQKCIRPPPNRTVLESESPPPYRSNSAGVLASSSSSSSGSDWSAGSAPLVVRCHSMSSTSKPATTTSSSHPQKTDFLQRTVKIFTGKKTQHHQQPPPAPTLPVVVVPTATRKAADHRPKPPPGV